MTKRFVLFLFAFVVTGCGMAGCPAKTALDLPDDIAELRDVAVHSRDAAKTARDTQSPAQAEAAAVRAEAAAAKAAALLEAAAAPTDADRAAKKDAALAARLARRHARLADEDRRLGEIVNGWKGRTYRTGRELAFPAVCNGLALAAEQADKTDVKELPESVRDSAALAADVAQQYAGRKPAANGQPDWPAVANDLRAVASAPPPEFGQALAVAFLLAKKKEFALYEIEMIDPKAKRDREQKTHYHLLRGFIYSANGMPLLGGEEMNKAPGVGGKDNPAYGPEMLAGAHLLLAYVYIESKDYEEADREIVRAMQAWPNNPVCVFLTGERLAATGEYEKAAGSLEEMARGNDKLWFADKVARRARELRDAPGKSQTLLHDNGFLCEIAIDYLTICAKKSDAAKDLQRSIDTAKEFSQKLLQQLPGN